eukprot:811702-Pleurochrysis_carterae.AAC.1
MNKESAKKLNQTNYSYQITTTKRITLTPPTGKNKYAPHTKGGTRSAASIKPIVKGLILNIQNGALKKLENHAQSIQKRIPSWFKRRLSVKREWEQNETVKIKDGLNKDQYGIYNCNSLQQLGVIASRHGIAIGTPWNTGAWDLDTEFTKPSNGGTKAHGNHTPVIRGTEHEIYPPNEGWITTKQHPIRLSDLTIRRMTTLCKTSKGRPSCQRKREQILKINTDWVRCGAHDRTPSLTLTT